MKNPNCPCKRTKCPRFGDCDACRAHHSKSEVVKAVLSQLEGLPPQRKTLSVPTCDRLRAQMERDSRHSSEKGERE